MIRDAFFVLIGNFLSDRTKTVGASGSMKTFYGGNYEFNS